MQKNNWLTALPLNKIQYSIELNDGTKKVGFLRFTKYQQQKHEIIMNNSENDIVEIAEIILNPEPNVIEFTKQQIEESLDIDEIRFLINVWLNKKVINPTLSQKLDSNFF